MSQKKTFTPKKLVFSGAAIALATVTANFLKTPSMPFGGSATAFSMLFVSLVGYWYGPALGLIAGISHGIIQFISNPYFIHPVQVLLDYILAFGALGLSGFLSQRKHGLRLGYTLGVWARYLFSSISGIIFYTSYVGTAKADILAVLSSLGYNLTYILPEYVFTMALLLIPAVNKALTSVKKIATE